MFDHLPSRRQMHERYLFGLTDEADEADDWNDPEERYYREEADDDDEWPLACMARLAVDIEARRAEVPNRWKLDWQGPGIMVWTTPSGRRYACDLTGEPRPLPLRRACRQRDTW